MTTKIKFSIITVLLCLLTLSVGVMFASEVYGREISAAITYDNPTDFEAESGIRWNPGNSAFEIFSMTGLSYLGSGLDVDVFGNVDTAAVYEKATTTNGATYHVMRDITYDERELREGSPFGITSKPDLGANGVFDGKNHKLIDFPLTATGANNYNAALFNNNYGTIRNIEINNTAAKSSTAANTSFICRINNEAGTIYGCKLTGAGIISTGNWLSGIAIRNDGVIQNSVNEINLTAVTNVGGIIGSNYGKIVGCINSGNMTTTSGDNGQFMGGIAVRTYIDSEINNCTNYGELMNTGTGPNCHFGGMVGAIDQSGAINGCKNYGKITTISANGRLGGIVGYITLASGSTYAVSDCINYGDIVSYATGALNGGVFGFIYREGLYNLTNCTNSGYIMSFASHYNGGMIGYTGNVPTINLINCINEGEIYKMDNSPQNGMVATSSGVWDFTGCTSKNSTGKFTWNSNVVTPDA